MMTVATTQKVSDYYILASPHICLTVRPVIQFYVKVGTYTVTQLHSMNQELEAC